MRRKWSNVLGAFAFVTFLAPAVCEAQYNPSGWIVVDAWNHALQFLNPFGAAPSPSVMKQNWVAPHVIGEEDPDGSAGELWRDVDFDASPSTGWDNGGLTPFPIWATTDFIYETFPQIPAGSLSGGDPGLINIQDDFVNVLNANLGPAAAEPVPGFTAIPGDNVMSMATTYVENTTGAPLLVEVCTASDDSIQAWINNVLVTNVSAARGSAGDCQERRPAILPPGVSKIATLVWEGGGGHNFRLALHVDGVRLVDGNGMVEFLGPEGAGQIQYTVDRSVVGDDPETGCNTSARVTLASSGGAADGMVTVVDQVDAHPDVVAISEVSDGGTVSNVGAFDDGIDLNTGAALEFFVLGPISNPGGAGPGDDVARQEYLTIGDDEVDGLAEGDTVTDVNGAELMVRRIRVNNGDGLDFNQVGGAGDNIMHYAWTQVTVTEETAVVVGGGSDDSVQMLVDGVEVAICGSCPRGWGGVGEIQDFTVSPVVTLSAGTHTILTKTYEGGGGHGVRLILLALPTGGVGAGSEDCNTPTPIAPGQFGVGSTKGAPLGAGCDPQASGANYYVIEGTGNPVTVQTCGRFLYDTYLASWTGSCDAQTCVASNDDTCGRQSQISFDTVEGEAYTVRVYGWDNREGPYILKVSDADNPAPAVDVSPLSGPTVCADPDGDCDPEALTISAQRITWTVPGSTLDDPGVGYTISGAAANFSNGSVSSDSGPIALVGGDTSSPSLIAEGDRCPPVQLAGLLGNDLTDLGDDGDETLYFPPDDLGGFDAEFFSSDESTFGAGEAAFNVFDNVVGGGDAKWCCGTAFPQIVGADFRNTLDEGVLLTHFTVTSANDTPDRDPRVWRIEGSNDGESWETIFEQNDPGLTLWGATRNSTLLFSEGVHYPMQEETYLMFRMVTEQTGLVGGAFFQIGEIEFFGEEPSSGVGPFVRGDVDLSGSVDLTDGIRIFNWLFLGGPEPACKAAANTNLSDGIDISSGVFLLNWLFIGGPIPPAPNAETGCGTSEAPADVALGCETPTC